ncbi:uncharacterized protein LOC143343501 [Colletes latitarsis]|uniref:uncharacterized protein LOC143343501 n=1 Tax=Colletes latitarsis TaxID=2605962 RepID=UPI0040369B9A
MFAKALETYAEVGNSDAQHLTLQMQKLERDLDAFNIVHDSLEELASDEQFEDRLSERLEFEEQHSETMRRARKILDKISEPITAARREENIAHSQDIPTRVDTIAHSADSMHPVNANSPLTITPDIQVQLPRMDLPKFNGAYEAWPGFADAFKSAVHENPNFRDTQRLIYLRSCLSGKAAEKLESLETTAANYPVAWELLEKYYNDPAIVINNRVKALFDLPTCSRTNSVALGELLDSAYKHYRALKALNKPFLEAFPVYAITSKLDEPTLLRWKEKTQGNPLPTVEELLEFLHVRRKVLENSTRNAKTAEKPSPPKRGSTETSRPTHAYQTTRLTCSICKNAHFTHQCQKLIRVSVDQRIEMVKKAGLCNNCLRPHHVASQCMSTGTCRRCNAKHHTLLHAEPLPSPQNSQCNLASLNTHCAPEILLSTAVIHIKDSNGRFHPCRVILDSGSQSNFLTEKITQKLNLAKRSTNAPVLGINQITSNLTAMVSTQIRSRVNKFSAQLTFLVTPRIAELLPTQSISKCDVKIPDNLPLADPGFRTPTEIDGLIGAEIFYELMCVGQLPIANSRARLQKTKFGWVVSGKTVPRKHFPTTTTCSLSLKPLQQQIAKFWEIEEPTQGPILSREENDCENHYRENTTRDVTTGKYIVKLPFKQDRQPLGDSFTIALRRFHSLEKSLNRNPELNAKYQAFLNEYRELGHMTKLDAPRTDEGYYLPHHAVVKDTSVTTKLRVVFDASAKTSRGTSLNDCLMTGPTIQEDLFSLLTRFRSHSIVLTADIEKMYRQTLVHPSERVFQKILWRASPRHPIDTYRLNTVTYGTTAAPFLAIRSLHQLAKDEGEQFRNAATVVLEDFYVDDLLTGAHTYEDARLIRDELIGLCNKGGLKLRQWASNDDRLLDSLNDRTDSAYVRLDLDETVKTLGLRWNAKKDALSYSISDLETGRRITKRTTLSQIASLFDPLGLLGPIIAHAKIIMQALWQLKLDWDESVPTDIHTAWTQYCQELTLLRDISFCRQVTAKNYESVELHGFCDASERAYGACIYLRSTMKNGKTIARLLCSKSRIAPLKTITLPRLELCAAELLAKLYKAVITALRKIAFDQTVFWSDSTVTLHWINTSPHMLKTFVAHRVSNIQTLTHGQQWRHIASEHNPADLISRGMTPKEFVGNRLWHYGPDWLTYPESAWPNTILTPINIPETRPTVALITIAHEWNILQKFSSFQRLKRVIAYCSRFINNCTSRERIRGPLSVEEIRTAETRIIKIVQREGFAKEIKLLQMSGNTNTNISSLNPFLDPEGILRVGGRLARATLPYATKHPALLPKDHAVTKSLIHDEHIKHFHAGTQATLNTIRQRFWIPSGRNVVRHILHKCTTCRRLNPSTPNYLMGDLPTNRVTPSRPFMHAGVDYCGPLFIKEKVQRNRNKVKVYLAIFVCFATKAIHIEIVNDLTTEAFLAAVRRFFSRRGKSSDIYSDNATNFVGASREVKEFFATIRAQKYNEAIAESLQNEGVRWHLIPPRSPHFGGLWEAAVKSTKHHLLRVIGDTLLSYEALLTYVNQIEAILNSRPLTPLSSDPNDLNSLTPAHFLIGDTLTSLPDYDLTAVPTPRLSTWQHVQQLRQHFWTRWIKEYLQEQTVRKKWHTGNTKNIQIGDLVILREDNTSPMQWPLGRIVDLHPGDDGVVRVVTVKTVRGTYKRCIKKLSPLPISD